MLYKYTINENMLIEVHLPCGAPPCGFNLSPPVLVT